MKGKIWFLIAIVFATGLTIYTLSYIVTQPWHALPGVWDDSAKNDFTYLYQSIYGKGFWFDGMNYPYGDNIVYADGQAALSVLFTCFKHVTVGEALTVLWLLVGLSYVLSVLFIYKTLIHFKVAPLIAIIFAGLICFCSPQLFRIGGHYGLSYLCVVPMLFYWTIQYHEKHLKKYCAYMFVLGIIAAFLHPYFLALVLVWVLFYVVAYFIFTKERLLSKATHVLPVVASVICLAGVVGIIMKITDPVKDRPHTPYGMLVYTTYKRDIITSIHSPIWQYVAAHPLLNRIVPHISDGSGEGYSYIGIVVAIAIIYSLLAGIVFWRNKNRERLFVSNEKFSPVWLFIAFGALLFSMGIPYVWHLEWLLNYMSFMRQFRSLGRFSWIFYYVITIYGAIVIYRLYARLTAQRRFIVGYILLFSSIVVWSVEANGDIQFVRNNTEKSRSNYDAFFPPSGQNWSSFLHDHHYNNNDFQAIIMVPFFHIGSDKLWVGETYWNLTIACEACFQLRTPMVDQLLSRSSWSQTEKQVKILAGPYADKPILRDIKNNKPFLLLYLDWASPNPDERYLLQASEYIGNYSHCNIYAFYPDRLAANDKGNADSVNKILPFMSSPDTCITDKGSWSVNHLDSFRASDMIYGNGALPAISGEDSDIATIALKPTKNTTEYEFSCWFLLGSEDYRSPFVRLQFFDSSANLIRSLDIITAQSVDNFNLWFRASGFFNMPSNCSYVNCILKKDPDPTRKTNGIVFYKAMDEIMLRPADALIISKAVDGSVMVNNHLFRKSAPANKK